MHIVSVCSVYGYWWLRNRTGCSQARLFITQGLAGIKISIEPIGKVKITYIGDVTLYLKNLKSSLKWYLPDYHLDVYFIEFFQRSII